MTAPTGQSGLAPGDCLQILLQLSKHQKNARFLADLPRSARVDLEDLFVAVRGFMAKDPHVGPMLEGAVDRLQRDVEFGSLVRVSRMDLRTVQNFLRVVPTVRRSA